MIARRFLCLSAFMFVLLLAVCGGGAPSAQADPAASGGGAVAAPAPKTNKPADKGADKTGAATATGAATKAPLPNTPENFVNSLSQRAISSLTASGISDTDREARFRELFLSSFDDLTIARFVLSSYWRVATEAQRGAFRDLFREVLVRTYARRFAGYHGETLTVQGSQPMPQGGGSEVNTVLNRGSEPPVDVKWRLSQGADGQYRVIDLVVEGVSMSVTQRNEYLALIQRNGGNVDALIAALQQRLDQP
ncbi:MAG: ABC transporter substrate-binding protein [Alphaproteobacteria bacterium]|nr:ABC transporter substrate-binding protein [Alphaproteobacteria bacterium]